MDEAAKRITCASNIQQIATALRNYADDHGGRLPTADHWQDDIKPYVKGADLYRCPAHPAEVDPITR